MSLRLAAPYPTIETITYLPNPLLSDVRRAAQSVETRRSMDNTVRTYVKTSQRKVFTYNMRLTRQKSLELRAFIESYYRSQIHMTDHDDRQWIVYLTNNPFDFSASGRAEGYPGDEVVAITLAFEGEEA